MQKALYHFLVLTVSIQLLRRVKTVHYTSFGMMDSNREIPFIEGETDFKIRVLIMDVD